MFKTNLETERFAKIQLVADIVCLFMIPKPARMQNYTFFPIMIAYVPQIGLAKAMCVEIPLYFNHCDVQFDEPGFKQIGFGST